MISKVNNPKTVEHLFDNWDETLIWSCLQQVMGNLYTDNPENPKSAMAILGDFAFYAGMPDENLILYKPDGFNRDFLIMVPQNEKWEKMIEQCYPEKAKKVSRYATKKESDVFDKEKLQQAISILPEGYSIKQIDETIYHRCQTMNWSKDLVSGYSDYETYNRLGLGFVILKGEEIISGASSYSSYLNGIEIEIDTHEPYRRKGLAYICGARLILECLAKNLYPSWDAQNKWSLSLAEKLGYHYSHEYVAYEIW